MKITGFNTSILSSHSDDVIRLFEDMGFEIRHQDTNPEGIVSGSVRLKNASGFAVDITGILPPHVIHLNASSHVETVALLTRNT